MSPLLSSNFLKPTLFPMIYLFYKMILSTFSFSCILPAENILGFYKLLYMCIIIQVFQCDVTVIQTKRDPLHLHTFNVSFYQVQFCHSFRLKTSNWITSVKYNNWSFLSFILIPNSSKKISCWWIEQSQIHGITDNCCNEMC